jgi:plastocyanin domain-containing protein
MSFCRCNSVTTITPKSYCGTSDCPLGPCIIVDEAESIYPCSQILVIDLTDKIKFATTNSLLPDKSEGNIVVLEHTANLTNVQFTLGAGNSTIELSVQSNYQGAPNTDYSFGTVNYELQQGVTRVRNKVIIIFKNKCVENGVVGQNCNPCTGLIDPSLSVDLNNNNDDPQISITL